MSPAEKNDQPGQVKAVILDDPKNSDLPVRSNDFSAVSAYTNLKQLFDRFDLYGISPEEYFQFAQLPIKVFYRSGIRPGPGKDGRTVNAQVRPEGWPSDQIAPPRGSYRPKLEVHLALGDLSTRARKPWKPGNPALAGGAARYCHRSTLDVARDRAHPPDGRHGRA